MRFVFRYHMVSQKGICKGHTDQEIFILENHIQGGNFKLSQSFRYQYSPTITYKKYNTKDCFGIVSKRAAKNDFKW